MKDNNNKISKAQVEKTHYELEGYSPLRIESVTQQLREIAYSGCKNILEVGVGKGLIKSFLGHFHDISHTSIDIAADLRPDVVGSVLNMPFENNQFELVICCQVLEHLRFSNFLPALREIRRVARKRAIISLPDIRKHCGIAFRIPGIKDWLKFDFNMKPMGIGYKKFDGQHYWEIGFKGSTGRDVMRAIREADFRVEKTYRLEKHRWHCFFILDVNKGLTNGNSPGFYHI